MAHDILPGDLYVQKSGDHTWYFERSDVRTRKGTVYIVLAVDRDFNCVEVFCDGMPRPIKTGYDFLHRGVRHVLKRV